MAAHLVIRDATDQDVDVLARALLEAANWNGESRMTLEETPTSRYLTGWPRTGDVGVVAETSDGVSVGAAWFRFLPADDAGYGYVADDVPELSIGVLPGHRGEGAGTRLMEALIGRARELRLRAISLSVEDGNRARQLYDRLGFQRVGRNGGSDTLLLELTPGA